MMLMKLILQVSVGAPLTRKAWPLDEKNASNTYKHSSLTLYQLKNDSESCYDSICFNSSEPCSRRWLWRNSNYTAWTVPKTFRMNKNSNQFPIWKDLKKKNKTTPNRSKALLGFEKTAAVFPGLLFNTCCLRNRLFRKKKFIHFDRNSQTSSSQLQQMAVQKTEDICLWLIRLCKRLWKFETELSTDLIPHRWEWSHLHMAKGLMVMQICKVILVDQEVTVEVICRSLGKSYKTWVCNSFRKNALFLYRKFVFWVFLPFIL